MRHYGDITKLNGYDLPVVDCITGGSPCQDLSVAGKRAGLDGERSGLFMEQIRIVKEMRAKEIENGRTAESVRPRWMVWENVPGAFSSNGGKDFQAVITEIVRIVNPECPDVPMPKDGRWSKAGCLYDELGRWSIAWRVHDAQFWGVPQRRKRIALVADFGGMCAPEVLFERKGLSRDIEQSEEKGQRTPARTERGFGESSERIDERTPSRAIAFQGKAGAEASLQIGVEKSSTLNVTKECMVCVWNGQLNQMSMTEQHVGALSTMNNQSVLQTREPILLESNQNHATVQTDGISTALPASMGMGGGYVPMVYENHSQDSRYRELGDVSEAMSAKYGTVGNNQPLVVYSPMDAVCIGNGQLNQISMAEQANTLSTMHDHQAVMVAAVDCRNGTENPDTNGTLQAKSTGGFGVNFQNVCRTGSIVRRLTPLECERLQGYPDGWTDIGEWVDTKGKKHKEADSPRYKALGNSIALPFWFYLLRRISATYERPATLGSLFDGIGGFPLCWERCNGKGTAVWASEIEEFPIAVTKNHFHEEEL